MLVDAIHQRALLCTYSWWLESLLSYTHRDHMSTSRCVNMRYQPHVDLSYHLSCHSCDWRSRFVVGRSRPWERKCSNSRRSSIVDRIGVRRYPRSEIKQHLRSTILGDALSNLAPRDEDSPESHITRATTIIFSHLCYNLPKHTIWGLQTIYYHSPWVLQTSGWGLMHAPFLDFNSCHFFHTCTRSHMDSQWEIVHGVHVCTQFYMDGDNLIDTSQTW